ncbi:hybrid sensor histidine kinase/response regulator [Candidatus Magnetominusculus xianensis]|uniref:histidine kinase n=1 Tax=Candidatus Magnetominusculus xianensis TaxID=1748249 RepID=A0ABR5SAU2_9BACT|nr:response regulator [Candidatus Magnetominusculus xianensis]KWT74994.1 response regulator receiver protein [Candidatus Magnetominusculus xianensis]MBF0404925.1 response regulator [Nitrospirota bacterium]
MSATAVLIVDDDRIIREQLEKDLSRGFYDVVTAQDGKSSVEAMMSNADISIVLIDINLPDLNGIELLRKLKEINPKCELIIMTGHGNSDLAIESLRCGAIDYIEKPFNMDELSAALGRAQEKLSDNDLLTSKNSILIIDDDELVVKRLAAFFRKEDFEVFTATSGLTGLEIIELNKIDVVITDINMSDMNGIEVLNSAKSFYKDIECIILTGMKDNEYAVRALRAGAADYITKPVNLDELLFSVKKAIERINLNRTRLYRNRELKISSAIISKMNEELDRRTKERKAELDNIQVQLFHTSKLTTLGEMSAGIAHEMNQPLGGIALVAKSFRKLLERDRLTQKEIESGLNDIETSVKRMSKIIQHIRTFARQDMLKFTEVDVVDTVNSAFSLLDEQLRLHEIEVIKDFSSSLPNVTGEPFQLEQVWINLITNARDAMNDKSRQQMSATPSSDYSKRLKVTVCNDAKAVIVAVNDNGVGMSPALKEKVLEPFFTTKEVGKGTGLGLSISYGIINNHNGRLEIESAEGAGTTVRVILSVSV